MTMWRRVVALASSAALFALSGAVRTSPVAADAGAGVGGPAFQPISAATASRWVHQLGDRRQAGAFQVIADATGAVYVSGFTRGTLPGSPEPNAGGIDAFVAKYSAAGQRLWVHQLGSTDIDLPATSRSTTPARSTSAV